MHLMLPSFLSGQKSSNELPAALGGRTTKEERETSAAQKQAKR
jgi:hypothetical protein